jgi:ACS family hexuronate transporter-like MFS transporter
LLAAQSGAIINAGGYVPLFAIGASAYLLALGIMQLLTPKLAPVQLKSV